MEENSMGQAIKTLRVHTGLSQKKLAKEAEISISYISLMERCQRNVTFSALQKIARVFGTPLFLIVFLAEKDTVNFPVELKERMLYEVMK
jgi:transcriptional regulator with XRE-family HTH domain